MTLLSCTAPPQNRSVAAVGFMISGVDIGTVVDSALASTEAYVLPPSPKVVVGPRRQTPSLNGHRAHARSKMPTSLADRAGTVEQNSEAKFKAAQAKAEKLGVRTLTKEDIEGLSYAQIKQLRGY
jgi:hypothetical protein